MTKLHLSNGSNEKSRKKRRNTLMIGLVLVSFILILCDARLKVVHYEIRSEKISAPVKIVLVTDLHSCWYGSKEHVLIDKIEEQNPDLILLGGDIFDDGLKDDNTEYLLDAISTKYPCFYVTGNHEYWTRGISRILDKIKGYGITILDGKYETVSVNGNEINVCGVDDPDAQVYFHSMSIYEQLSILEETIDNDAYTILLSHRPEFGPKYFQYGFDLVLCGHAHGGQWRIPGILNGLYAPDQGMFPKYAGGEYFFDEGEMIVSRGLARESTKVPRIFNRPELVVITLTTRE